MARFQQRSWSPTLRIAFRQQAVYGLRLYQHYVLCVTTRAIHDYQRFIPILTGKGILPCVGRFRGFPLYLECKLNFPKIGRLYSRTGCLAYHLCVIDSYKINIKMKIYFQLFLISTFTLRSHGLATVSPTGESRITGSLHTLLSRLFVPVPNTHPRLSDCFHATVPLSAYVGFKCHFSASALPVVRIAVRQMLARNLRLFHELWGGCGIRTHDVLRFFATVLGCLYRRLRPLSQPACLRFTFFSKIYLNNFISSYKPSAMFFAI